MFYITKSENHVLKVVFAENVAQPTATPQVGHMSNLSNFFRGPQT